MLNQKPFRLYFSKLPVTIHADAVQTIAVPDPGVEVTTKGRDLPVTLTPGVCVIMLFHAKSWPYLAAVITAPHNEKAGLINCKHHYRR